MTATPLTPPTLTDAPVAAAAHALQLLGLVKRYGAGRAVDGVSLDLRAGEFLTMLGPSGSGKTTTLNMIAGFADVDEGEILMDGRPIADIPAHKRNIGVVFQHYALFPHMTAAENVAFPLRRRRVARDARVKRVAQALDMVRLGDFADRYPRQLSGGQQQRVALARALVFEPRVLLMDEPLGALDKKLREWLQVEFKRIHRELGITFVYVTHDQEEAMVLSDRVAVFNTGRIEQVGTGEELYERPRTRFVAEFVGDSNVFSGTLRRGSGELECAARRLTVPPGELADGIPSALVVRPEKVGIVSEADATDANVLNGTVRELIYLGNARKLEVVLPDGMLVLVRESGVVGPPIERGDEVLLTWATDDAVLVRDDAGPAPNVSPPKD
jgi:putative spermidine/putrescine transport system ATP-binding protein